MHCLPRPAALDYHKYGMRTTPSRFSAYTAMTGDRAYEAAPTLAKAPVLPVAGTSFIEQRHPAIVQALTLLWGRPEMNQYFQKIADGHAPAPELNPAALAELMLLADIHRRICPFRPAKSVEDLYGKGHWADTWKPARQRN